MKDYTQKLLEKADRSILAAMHLKDKADFEFAIGRAYYAMFYVTEALLNELDLRFSKHGGVHGAFGEHYVKTGLFAPQYHRWLLAAFNRRIISDYGIDASFTADEAQDAIQQAQQFVDAARVYLNSPKSLV